MNYTIGESDSLLQTSNPTPFSGGLGQECRYFSWDSLTTNCVLIGAQALTAWKSSTAAIGSGLLRPGVWSKGQVYSVRGSGTVRACWNMVIPSICPDLPAEQKEALRYGVKVPLVYTVVALRNWKAFQKLGIRGGSCPGMYHSSINLDQAINIADYEPVRSPDEPVFSAHDAHALPALASQAREQQRAGHYELLATPFETFERNIRDQLARVLGSAGFDPARDIDAITVNRWPHGYAYEYNPLWDPDWREGKGPCDIARQRFGRITIANSDAAAAAIQTGAIDQGYRAVQ
jgi:spermidine dehydrogenase